jgi:hypothetical protein
MGFLAGAPPWCPSGCHCLRGSRPPGLSLLPGSWCYLSQKRSWFYGRSPPLYESSRVPAIATYAWPFAARPARCSPPYRPACTPGPSHPACRSFPSGHFRTLRQYSPAYPCHGWEWPFSPCRIKSHCHKRVGLSRSGGVRQGSAGFGLNKFGGGINETACHYPR